MNSATNSVTISIYSDYYGFNIQCTPFTIVDGSFISFNDLEVPCVDEILVSVVENGATTNQVYTVRVPCNG